VNDYKKHLVVHVAVDEATGTAMVTGPKDGIWNTLAIEAGATKWNSLWGGWLLETPAQLSDLCCLCDIYGAIYKQVPRTPDLLAKRQAARRAKAQKGRTNV